MNSDQEWNQALRESPEDSTLRLAYADWLEERGQRLEACKMRQQAGAGTLVFSLWHPQWGEKRVGEWTTLQHLKNHVHQKQRHNYRRPGHYEAHGQAVPAAELVVVIEWRAHAVEVDRRPYTREMQV
jgi:uncharacterized protein (TIGR02996 family)